MNFLGSNAFAFILSISTVTLLTINYIYNKSPSSIEFFSSIDYKVYTPPRAYVVMGADTNHIYLFPLIVTIRNWKRNNVNSILCFAEPRENFMRDEATRFIFETIIAEEGVQYIFLNTSLSPKHTITQTCRLYITASPEIKLDDEDLLLTSDSDFWILHIEEHLPHDNQKILTYGIGCCGKINKPKTPKKMVPNLPMSTICMKAKLWREIIGVSRNWLTNGDVLARRLYEEFDDVEFIRNGTGKPKISKSWYADQMIISERIDDWIKRDGNEKYLGRYQWFGHTKRLDRAWWKNDFSNVDLSKFHDAHILHPLGEPNNWKRTLPLLKKMFDKSDVEWFEQIHKEYARIAVFPPQTTPSPRPNRRRFTRH